MLRRENEMSMTSHQKRFHNHSKKENNMLNQNEILQIEKIIGYQFKNKDLLKTAFTHSSFAYSHNQTSNERLEFLGDSVLNLCTTEYLFKNFDFDEGVSSKIRAYLVSSEYVCEYIKSNNLEKFLQCDNFNPANSTNVMCDLFEAIVGAMYLDSGFEQCKKFIYASLKYSKELVENVKLIIVENVNPKTTENVNLTKRDYKSELQEYLQQFENMNLEYVQKDKKGPAHQPIYTMAVKINDDFYGKADGKRKKDAENIAAKLTLEMLKLKK